MPVGVMEKKVVGEGVPVADVVVEEACARVVEKEAAAEGVFEEEPAAKVILLGSCEEELDRDVVEKDECEGESEGAVLAVGCKEAVSEMLAEAVGVGLRDVLALPESSQHEELLLAPASE